MDILSSLNLGLSDDEQDGEDTPEIVRQGISQFASMLPAYTSTEPLPPPGKKRAKKRKSKKKKPTMEDEDTKPSVKKQKSQWADKCMYAELLEMKPETAWEHTDDGGLPDDLESGWIAVGGVPVGKRCLAITYHSSGVAGSGDGFVGAISPLTDHSSSSKHNAAIKARRKAIDAPVSIDPTVKHCA